VGQQTAAGTITLRAQDGSFPNPPPPPFTGGTGPGVWRPTVSYLPGPPPSFAPMEIEWLANVVPFTLTSPSQFRADPPPALTSRRYARSYNEVQAMGALSSSIRSFDQTDLAYFWATNHFVVWNRALRDIASEHVADIGESARPFTLVNLAMATLHHRLGHPADAHVQPLLGCAEDVVNARVYEGIHFRFTDLTARRQGRQVARWAFRHFLRPVDGCGDDDDSDSR
jgi:hypothetical protein